MRTLLPAAVAGLLVTGIVLGYAAAVSTDMRVVYGLGLGLLFLAGQRLGARGGARWVSWPLLTLPLLTTFWFGVIPQMPRLWPHLPLWALAALCGAGWSVADLRGRRAWRTGAVILAAFSIYYVLGQVPAAVARSLNRFEQRPAPGFALQSLDGQVLPAETWEGRILLLDFFGTWCVPCRAELKELQLVREGLRHRPDLVFLVVANDSGGDTPERVSAFMRESRTGIPFAYDHGGKAHSAFGFTGVPALVVIDKSRQIRLRREGFNAADTDFARDLKAFLEGL